MEEVKYIFLIIYVVAMCYIILGCGFRLPALAKWMTSVEGKVAGKTIFGEIVKAVLSWPWFKIEKLKEKYNG